MAAPKQRALSHAKTIRGPFSSLASKLKPPLTPISTNQGALPPPATARELDAYPGKGTPAGGAAAENKSSLLARFLYDGGHTSDAFLTAASAQVGQVMLTLPSECVSFSPAAAASLLSWRELGAVVLSGQFQTHHTRTHTNPHASQTNNKKKTQWPSSASPAAF